MLSFKQIGTICLSVLIPTFSVFATPDIASNSNGNGSCVEPVLHRYDGSANLQAGWQAKTIQLKWYNGDEQLDVQDAADSCVYDGVLTLPSTHPTRTDYAFAGWRVRPQYDFSTLPTNELGTEAGEGLVACNMDDFNYLHNAEWKIVFSWGTVYGMSMCSSTPASLSGESGYPIES